MKGRKGYEEGTVVDGRSRSASAPRRTRRRRAPSAASLHPTPCLKTKSLAFGVVNEGHEAGIGFLYTLYGEHI